MHRTNAYPLPSYSKHMFPVMVLSLTPLNDLVMTSPDRRARSG